MSSIFYLDYENGSDANDGSDWAHAWKTITSGATVARIAAGDVIRIAKSPAPASVGNATWTNLSKTVTLAAAQNLNVDLCETNWTANGSGDVTPSSIAVATDAKEGSYCQKLLFDATVQTSIMQAYREISETDFSAYQKISFWIKNNGAITAGTLRISLCSDTAGATPVDYFDIPAIPSTSQWIPLTLTKSGGGNLGASIKSIALYTNSAVTGLASKYIYLDDIIACTTNGLNLQSLISKNSLEQGGNEAWYGIQSINSATILLDNDTSKKSNSGKGYFGTTETVATYKRETIKTALAAISSTQVQAIQASGTSGSNIQFQGGYNTSTNEQDGETFFDGLNGYGYGLYATAKTFITINRLNFSRYYAAPYLVSASNFWSFGSIFISNCYDSFIISNCHNSTIETISSVNGSSLISFASCFGWTIGAITNCNNGDTQGLKIDVSANFKISSILSVSNNTNYGIQISDRANKNIINLVKKCDSNGIYGVYFNGSFNNKIFSISTSANATSSIYSQMSDNNFVKNATISEETKITFSTSFIYANPKIFLGSIGGDTDDNQIFSTKSESPAIRSQTATRHTASGTAWKFAPQSGRNLGYKLDLSIAKIAVVASKLVTVKAWMKKDHASNIGCDIVCEGGQIAGVAADVSATKADDTDWEELTITFTPTEAGVVEILARAWYVAGNSYAYVDDLTITQAD